MARTDNSKNSAGSTKAPPQRSANLYTPNALDEEFFDSQTPPQEQHSQLPTYGFSGRFWKVDLEQPSDPRVRLERPALFVWLVVSCFWQGFMPWLLLGLALIAYALLARGAFRQYGLGARTWVYSALGLGQIMLAFSYIANLGSLWPFIGLYWLATLLTWIILETRDVLGSHGRSVF